VGGTRSVLLIPPPPKSGGSTIQQQQQHDDSISALATMSNPDVALRVLTAFRHMSTTFLKDGDDRSLRNFAVHPVPTNPDIPMPPAFMDKESVQLAGEALYKAFVRCQEGGVTGGEENGMNRTANAVENIHPNTSHGDDTSAELQDPATTGDDDGVDPLESPAVLEAVRKFREHLTVLQGSKATKRQKLVADAIAKELPIMRQRIVEERSQAAATAATVAAELHVPPPPPLPPPPPTFDAPRGVSNKPAWMTHGDERSDVPSDGPPNKRIKLNVADPALTFPTISPQNLVALRQYISGRIQHYLGEEEESLIAFVYNHVIQGNKSVSAVLPELTDVLDEDAPAFLQSIFDYCQELTTV
jgi:PWI domain